MIDGFALDGESGPGLVSAVQAHLDRADGWVAEVGELGRPLALGANQVGVAMAERCSQWTDGVEESFASVMVDYRAAVARACEAVTDSVDAYGAVDDRLAGTVRAAGAVTEPWQPR